MRFLTFNNTETDHGEIRRHSIVRGSGGGIRLDLKDSGGRTVARLVLRNREALEIRDGLAHVLGGQGLNNAGGGRPTLHDMRRERQRGDDLKRERDAIQREWDVSRQRLVSRAASLDKAWRERDAARRERDAARRELNAATHQKNEARNGRDEALRKLNALRYDRNEALRKLIEAGARNGRMTLENDTLSRYLAAAQRDLDIARKVAHGRRIQILEADNAGLLAERADRKDRINKAAANIIKAADILKGHS